MPEVIALLLDIIIGVFFLPIFGLTLFHVVLVLRGRTTNEQVTNKFDESPNPFSRGLFWNCLDRLCGTQRITLKNRRDGVRDVEATTSPYLDHIPLEDVRSSNLSEAHESPGAPATGENDERYAQSIKLPKSNKTLPPTTHIQTHNIDPNYVISIAKNGTGRRQKEPLHVVTMAKNEK